MTLSSPVASVAAGTSFDPAPRPNGISSTFTFLDTDSANDRRCRRSARADIVR
jgi:hypothetical protein